jgi:hypothetical protein
MSQSAPTAGIAYLLECHCLLQKYYPDGPPAGIHLKLKRADDLIDEALQPLRQREVDEQMAAVGLPAGYLKAL